MQQVSNVLNPEQLSSDLRFAEAGAYEDLASGG